MNTANLRPCIRCGTLSVWGDAVCVDCSRAERKNYCRPDGTALTDWIEKDGETVFIDEGRERIRITPRKDK